MNYGSLENIREHSTFYEFIEIDHDAHHEKVRFFEDNKFQIYDLEFEYKIHVWCDYALSVFEIGRYQEFIKLSDELIPLIIKENVFRLRDIKIYEALLFRKGASLYNIQKFDEAEYVFQQLCRIESEVLYQRAWMQTMQKILKNKMRFVQALSVLLFIFTAVIIAIELLIIRNFYPTLTNSFELFRIFTFFLGISSLIGLEVIIRYKARKLFKSKI